MCEIKKTPVIMTNVVYWPKFWNKIQRHFSSIVVLLPTKQEGYLPT